jgi:dihydroneopterin aldolase
MDKIQLEGMVFYGYHGVAPEEQTLGQRFVVDVEAERGLRAAGVSDDPGDTVDYSLIYQAVKQVVEGPSRKLLENIAEEIAGLVLKSFDVEAVRVKVRKPEVPIKGSVLAHASIEIYRRKDYHPNP